MYKSFNLVYLFIFDLSTVDAAVLESSLSPADLVQFEGCVIPPPTPQRQENSDRTFYWENMADCHEQALGKSLVFNKEVNLSVY